jgi:ribose transport system substrate-binding protein
MKRILIACAAAVVAISLAACSGPAPSSSGSSGAKKTLGIVALVATDALNAAVINGATDAANKAGWDVKVIDTQGSVDKANAAMTTFSTTQKVDGIAVMAFLSTSLGSGLASAKAANIPVVSWGGTIVPGIVATTSALKVGEDSVNGLLSTFGKKGNVLALTYHTGVLCLYRGVAFDAAMKKNPSITVTSSEVAIPGQVNDGTKYTAGWLASHPAGSTPLAVWGSWDEPAMGAIAAIKQSGRTDVKVYSINGGPQALQAVKDGTLEQVVWQDGFTEGKDLMNAVADFLKAGSAWKAKTFNVPGVVVDKNTIDQFLADHPDALK